MILTNSDLRSKLFLTEILSIIANINNLFYYEKRFLEQMAR